MLRGWGLIHRCTHQLLHTKKGCLQQASIQTRQLCNAHVQISNAANGGSSDPLEYCWDQSHRHHARLGQGLEAESSCQSLSRGVSQVDNSVPGQRKSYSSSLMFQRRFTITDLLRQTDPSKGLQSSPGYLGGLVGSALSMQPTGSAAGYSTISIAKGTPDVKVPEGGKVRLVHPDGSHKILSFQEAKKSAKTLQADLILVSASAKPPVFKLGLANQVLLEQKSKEKAARKKQLEIRRSQLVKEMKIGAKAAEYDLDRQLKVVQGFIEKGQKVRVVVSFKQRDADFAPKQMALIIEKCSPFSEVQQSRKSAAGSKSFLLQPLSSSEKP